MGKTHFEGISGQVNVQNVMMKISKKIANVWITGFKVESIFFFFSSRRRHTRFDCDWSSDVCSSDLAVAKLGGNRGDVVQAAQGMADVLDKLSVQLGNEFGEDSLLIIAAYGQGAAGDTMKMRNMLQDLANKFPESSRAIRTIWFLQKNGKITQSEFDSALSFLAIGTISQNPKEFGVNAEALTL